MKRNDLQELKKLDEKALLAKVLELKADLANLVMDKQMSKLTDLKAPIKMKRDIARYLTIFRQKQLVREYTENEVVTVVVEKPEIKVEKKVAEKVKKTSTKKGEKGA